MAITKHVGKYGEKPCIVLFREVPNEPENCLVVLTGGLAERDHDDIINVINSPEAQEASEVSVVLKRRDFSHGGNMLTTLHQSGKITKVPVSMVSLTPAPSQSVPLADVNAEIRKLTNDPVPPINDAAHLNETAPKQHQPLPEVIEPDAGPAAEPAVEDKAAIAESLNTQADLMEADAQAILKEVKEKRAEAKKLSREAVKADK